jgi:3-hydroxyacyl-[acyl-carrier-protein] dehydratase
MKNTLLDTFYSEISSTFDSTNSSTFKVQIHLNPEHRIYKGHFEQVPITPGVCQTQIIKEILMEKFKVELQLWESDSLKFLAMINPQINPELTIDFNLKKTDSVFEVNAVISHEKTVFTKFKGKFNLI